MVYQQLFMHAQKASSSKPAALEQQLLAGLTFQKPTANTHLKQMFVAMNRQATPGVRMQLLPTSLTYRTHAIDMSTPGRRRRRTSSPAAAPSAPWAAAPAQSRQTSQTSLARTDAQHFNCCRQPKPCLRRQTACPPYSAGQMVTLGQALCRRTAHNVGVPHRELSLATLKHTFVSYPTLPYHTQPYSSLQCAPLASQSCSVPLTRPAAMSAPSSPYAHAVTATRPGRVTVGLTTVRCPAVSVSHTRSVPSSLAVSAVCLRPVCPYPTLPWAHAADWHIQNLKSLGFSQLAERVIKHLARLVPVRALPVTLATIRYPQHDMHQAI